MESSYPLVVLPRRRSSCARLRKPRRSLAVLERAAAKLVSSLMSRTCLTRAEYESRIGTEVGISTWITLDQPRIDDFAAATLDRQFIHVDPLAAGRTQFGGTIAHGFFTWVLLTARAKDPPPAVKNTKAEINLGFNGVRFVAPVRSGKRVRG